MLSLLVAAEAVLAIVLAAVAAELADTELALEHLVAGLRLKHR
jgi:hypothetical protein